MAILSVVWTIGLLTVIGASMLWNGELSYRQARTAFELSAAQVLADAGINRAILALLDSGSNDPWRTDGLGRDFWFEGEAITIVLQDELGRIDLNSGDPGLVTGLIRSAGYDAEAAAALTDKILDWRQPSRLKHVNGAAAADYRAAGLAYVPRGGPFQNVEELLLVMGMTPELFRRIEPALTVYSGRPFVDPNVAPRETLLAMPGMTIEKADIAIATRVGRPALSAMAQSATLAGRAFDIRARVSRSGASFERQAVVRFTGHPAQPYWVLNWRAR